MITKILEHIRKYRSGYLLAITSIFFILYSLYIHNKSKIDWGNIDSVTEYIRNISTFIPVALVLSGIIIGVFDIMKLFSDVYNEGKKKAIKEAVKNALKLDRNKTKTQILQGLKDQGINGENLQAIENIIDQVISEESDN